MKKILTVIGARPQFIKAAMMSRALAHKFEEVLVHTGQHYDANMSDVFFEELNISFPKYNLGISGGSHGSMTGRMLILLEEIIRAESPDMVLVYGDTNSTMAGALAAVKLGIPVAHVEAGNNRGSLANPEDINRIVSDHVSSLLFACVQSAMVNLKKENLEDKSFFVGDSMYDAFKYYSECNRKNSLEHVYNFEHTPISIPEDYYFMTCHRQENSNEEKLFQILSAAQELDNPVIYAVHPRNHQKVDKLRKEYHFDNIILIEPVGYLTSVSLINGAKKIITDSGGLQREAFFAKKPCVTIFDYSWWPETLHNGMNRLVKAEKNDILDKLSMEAVVDDNYLPFGDGNACEKMCKIIEQYII